MTGKVLVTLLLVAVTALGAGLFHWSRAISQRFGAWTASFRARNPRSGPPPLPEEREMYTKLILWILRFSGACFVLQSLMALILLWRA